MLGVPLATLKRFGAVSRETAEAMARGAVKNSRAHIAVSITGIAGPGGGSAAKPVGLVHIATAKRNGENEAREFRFGDLGRDGIRMATVEQALWLLHVAL
jgi:nicotinamide-nucleotide amidase